MADEKVSDELSERTTQIDNYLAEHVETYEVRKLLIEGRKTMEELRAAVNAEQEAEA